MTFGSMEDTNMVHYGSLTMHTHVLVDGFRGQA